LGVGHIATLLQALLQATSRVDGDRAVRAVNYVNLRTPMVDLRPPNMGGV